MKLLAPRVVTDMSVAVTNTATLLYTLADTASSTSQGLNYYTGKECNAVSLRAQDGDIRVAIGATPTSTTGMLIKQGTRQWVHGDISTLKLIRTGGANVQVEVVYFYSVKPDEVMNALADTVGLAAGSVSLGEVQRAAATTSTGGTVAATNAAGGTQIVAANANRFYTQLQNNGTVDVYFGTGTVTSSFPKLGQGEAATWDSQEALKVLSSGVNANIAFIDYNNS